MTTNGYERLLGAICIVSGSYALVTAVWVAPKRPDIAVIVGLLGLINYVVAYFWLKAESML